MRALWQGMNHPDIQWGTFSHFDWGAHDRIVMSGGIASHAVISPDECAPDMEAMEAAFKWLDKKKLKRA